jgi:hypothetical protein
LRTHVILTEEPVLNIVKEGISLCYTGFSWLFIAGSARWFDRLTMTLVFMAFRSRIGEMVRQAHHDIGFSLLFLIAAHYVAESVRWFDRLTMTLGFVAFHGCIALPDR